LAARLVLSGGFTVTDSQQQRHLQQQATRLGFTDLRACLQALLDQGWSVPQLATHLDTTQPVIRRAITDHHVRQPSRRQQLARQRQHAAQQRATARAIALGFPNVRVYLMDRLVTKAWTLKQVQGELGVAPATLRRLLDQHQVRRVAPTRRQRRSRRRPRHAGAGGPAAPPGTTGRARLRNVEEYVQEYVQDRYLTLSWSLRRLCAELGVGYDWLDQQLTQLGLRS